jgi:hypothetical protein
MSPGTRDRRIWGVVLSCRQDEQRRARQDSKTSAAASAPCALCKRAAGGYLMHCIRCDRLSRTLDFGAAASRKAQVDRVGGRQATSADANARSIAETSGGCELARKVDRSDFQVAQPQFGGQVVPIWLFPESSGSPLLACERPAEAHEAAGAAGAAVRIKPRAPVSSAHRTSRTRRPCSCFAGARLEYRHGAMRHGVA